MELDQSPLWEIDRPLQIGPGLIAPPRGAFVRLEYLLWTIEEPGAELLGATPPPNEFDNPDADFDEGFEDDGLFNHNFDPANGYAAENVVTNFGAGRIQRLFGLAYVPRLREIDLHDNSGIRLTFGLPTTNYGTFEVSGWMLEHASDHYEFGPREFQQVPGVGAVLRFPDDGDEPIIVNNDRTTSGIPFFPATTFDIEDGQQFVTIPFEQINVTYQSDIFGADARYIVDALAPDGEGFKIKPLIGLKYVSFQEAMYQRGVVNTRNAGLFATSFNADTTNNYIGGTIGLRTELVHRWFVLGLEPAATLSANIAESSVVSEGFPNFDDSHFETNSSYFDFAPILELKAYTRIKLGDSWRITVAYDAMWISRAFRAARAIDYEATSGRRPGLNPAPDTTNSTDHVTVDGLSLGLEYVF